MTGNRSIINFLVSIKGEQGSTITPQVQDMQGRWAKSSFIRVNPGGNVTLAPEVENEKGGSWAWTGPENFFAGTREVRLQTVTSPPPVSAQVSIAICSAFVFSVAASPTAPN